MSGLLEEVVAKCNTFDSDDSPRESCVPFCVDGQQVGLILPEVLEILKQYKDVFTISTVESSGKQSTIVSIADHLRSFDEISDAVAHVLNDMRSRDLDITLRGWRNEFYDVKARFCDKSLFKMERSATSLFGLVTYGTHLNGYTYNDKNEMMMWIAQRSPTKATFPGLYDNLCAGGLPAGMGIEECMRKECAEEASLGDKLLDKMKAVGTVSYVYHDKRSISAECEFVFDLELPRDFEPKNADGEVQKFFLMSFDEIKDILLKFKPNCALIIVDFMIRHGIITQDNEPNYAALVEEMHRPLQTMYGKING